MDFHPGKCNILSISRKAKPTDHEYKLHDQILENISYNIKPELEWPHYNVCGKANKAQCFLITPVFKHQFHIHMKESAYKSLTRSLLEFA